MPFAETDHIRFLYKLPVISLHIKFLKYKSKTNVKDRNLYYINVFSFYDGFCVNVFSACALPFYGVFVSDHMA